MFGNKNKEVQNILVTTTDTIENRTITDYLGVVSGCEAYKAVDGVHNHDYNYAEAYQKAVKNAVTKAIKQYNADAIIGLTTNISYTGIMQEVIVTVQGTCVTLN